MISQIKKHRLHRLPTSTYLLAPLDNISNGVNNLNFNRCNHSDIYLTKHYKVTFILTYRCNLRCKICKIWETSPEKEEIKLDAIERIFKCLNGFNWIDLTDGEITLREDLTEVVRVLSAGRQVVSFVFEGE